MTDITEPVPVIDDGEPTAELVRDVDEATPEQPADGQPAKDDVIAEGEWIVRRFRQKLDSIPLIRSGKRKGRDEAQTAQLVDDMAKRITIDRATLKVSHERFRRLRRWNQRMHTQNKALAERIAELEGAGATGTPSQGITAVEGGQDQAEHIINDARQLAERILIDARQEAERIRAEGNVDALAVAIEAEPESTGSRPRDALNRRTWLAKVRPAQEQVVVVLRRAAERLPEAEQRLAELDAEDAEWNELFPVPVGDDGAMELEKVAV